MDGKGYLAALDDAATEQVRTLYGVLLDKFVAATMLADDERQAARTKAFAEYRRGLGLVAYTTKLAGSTTFDQPSA